jgi:hypothetical protein
MKLVEVIQTKRNTESVSAAFTRAVQGTGTQKDIDLISKNAQYAYDYAKYYIKGRWPKGEPAILTRAWQSYEYAVDILKSMRELE